MDKDICAYKTTAKDSQIKSHMKSTIGRKATVRITYKSQVKANAKELSIPSYCINRKDELDYRQNFLIQMKLVIRHLRNKAEE